MQVTIGGGGDHIWTGQPQLSSNFATLNKNDIQLKTFCSLFECNGFPFVPKYLSKIPKVNNYIW